MDLSPVTVNRSVAIPASDPAKMIVKKEFPVEAAMDESLRKRNDLLALDGTGMAISGMALHDRSDVAWRYGTNDRA